MLLLSGLLYSLNSEKKGDLRPARAGAKRNPFVSRWHVGAFWPVVPASDDGSRPVASAPTMHSWLVSDGPRSTY